MNDSSDIVYLESRMGRIRGRWRAMSRIARLGIVSVVFGLIGLLTSFFLTFIPFLSFPFSMVGLVIGGLAFGAGFYHNLRRDGFWFPLAGVVLSLLALAISMGNWSNHQENEKRDRKAGQQAALDEARQKFAGRWLRDDSDAAGNVDSPSSLEMTEAGSLLWVITKGGETDQGVARFDFRESSIVVSFGDTGQGQRSMVRYRVDTSRPRQLLLSDRRQILGKTGSDFTGVWNHAGPPRMLSAAEKVIADYRNKLQRFETQSTEVDGLVQKFERQRRELLDRLRPYEAGELEKDEAWRIQARELGTVVNQIALLNRRKPQIERAILLLETAIGRIGRQAELDQIGLDTRQLEDLLLTTDRLEDQLKRETLDENVQQILLDQVVQGELKKNGD